MSDLASALRARLSGWAKQPKAQVMPTRLAFMAKRGPGLKNIGLGERFTHVPVEIPDSLTQEPVVLRSRVNMGATHEYEADGFMSRPREVSPVMQDAVELPSLMAGISDEVPFSSLATPEAAFVTKTALEEGDDIPGGQGVQDDYYKLLTSSPPVPRPQAARQLPKQFRGMGAVPAPAPRRAPAQVSRWPSATTVAIALAAVAGCAWNIKSVRTYVWGMLGKGGE